MRLAVATEARFYLIDLTDDLLLADCDWEDNAGAEDAAVLFEEKWLAFLLSSNFQWDLQFKKSEWNRNLKQWRARQVFENGQRVDWDGLR